jgi:hypothetical protein
MESCCYIANRPRASVRQAGKAAEIYARRASFHNFTEMSVSDFERLETAVGPQITLKKENNRETISVSRRRAVVSLPFLAAGYSYIDIF